MRITIQKLGNHLRSNSMFKGAPTLILVNSANHHIRQLVVDIREFFDHFLAELRLCVRVDLIVGLNNHLNIDVHLLF
jgi:hypothetical protein